MLCSRKIMQATKRLLNFLVPAFLGGCAAHGITSFFIQWSNPGPPGQWKHWVLTTGLTGNSQHLFFFSSNILKSKKKEIKLAFIIVYLTQDRGWKRLDDGWMASSIQWTWVWANFARSRWRTGKPDMLQSMQSQSDTTERLKNNSVHTK